MGTSQHKVFPTYIMQGDFTLLPPVTVSTVEAVKAAQLPHNPSALTADWLYTRRELSCRISPSRPDIRSSFYLYHICPLPFSLNYPEIPNSSFKLTCRLTFQAILSSAEQYVQPARIPLSDQKHHYKNDLLAIASSTKLNKIGRASCRERV